MEYRAQDIIASKHGKESRLVVCYKGRLLEVAKLSITSGGSFVFSLTSPTSNVINLGSIAVSPGQKQICPSQHETTIQVEGGFHFSLHPPSKINPKLGNTVHIRSNATINKKGAVYDSVINNWYPVDTPRNVLNFYTAPMEKLIETKKTSRFVIPVPDTHIGSLRGKVDFYPRNTQTITRYKSCFNEIHGFCPDYRILISFFLHRPTEPALLYPVKADYL